MTDKQNPKQKEYYSKTAELISIWWYKFFKPEFLDQDSRINLDFDPETICCNRSEPVNLIQEYTKSVLIIIEESWNNFIKSNRNIREEKPKEFQARIIQLIDEINQFGYEASEIRQQNRQYVEEIIPAGMRTGVETITHAIALLGERFQSRIPLMFSKVQLTEVGKLRSSIGIDQGDMNLFYGHPKVEVLTPTGDVDKKKGSGLDTV